LGFVVGWLRRSMSLGFALRIEKIYNLGLIAGATLLYKKMPSPFVALT
jgi:hypothetical protein